MKHNIAIGTHHKTGTHWMADVFKSLSIVLDVPFINLSTKTAEQQNEILRKRLSATDKKCIVFHNHSIFPEIIYNANFKGIHLIRDPRDIIISGVKYQEKTDAKWVHAPKEKFGNKSIQEMLKSFDNLEDKLIFEIKYIAKKNFSRMVDFKRSNVFVDVHYEQLINDRTLKLSTIIFKYLGLNDKEIIQANCVIWQNSLFGSYNAIGNTHIQDGSAKQYLKVYTQKCYEAFKNQGFEKICEELGYEGHSNYLLDINENINIPDYSKTATENIFKCGYPEGIHNALSIATNHYPNDSSLLKQINTLRSSTAIESRE